MRNFENAKRIVVKIGTSILTKDAGVDAGYVRRVAGQINSLLDQDRQVVIISSGAIGMADLNLLVDYILGRITQFPVE